MQRYLFLVKEDSENDWRYIGEADADNPEDAIETIARMDLADHGPQVTLEDVVNNMLKFSYWRVIPIRVGDDDSPQQFQKSDLDLEHLR